MPCASQEQLLLLYPQFSEEITASSTQFSTSLVVVITCELARLMARRVPEHQVVRISGALEGG